jgi:enoyl-CoA hydratase
MTIDHAADRLTPRQDLSRYETDQPVLYAASDGIATVTMNRPKVGNAQNSQMTYALDAAFKSAVDDDTVRVIVLRGAGKHFNAGHDIGTPGQDLHKQFDRKQLWWDHSNKPGGEEIYSREQEIYIGMCRRWHDIPKPTIAMVHGYCIFGGWMIATAMDLIFAARDARFLASQFEYFSVPWDIHPRKAKELVFESRFLSGEEARAEGLVNRAYAAERLEAETLAYAERVAENDPTVLRLSKLAINKAQDLQGYSVGIEGAFADYLVTAQSRGNARVAGRDRLAGVDLALRGERGERPGLES